MSGRVLNEHAPAFGRAIAPWHHWFAWYPVPTWDGRWSWLRTLHRRWVQKHDYLTGGPLGWWEYERHDGYCVAMTPSHSGEPTPAQQETKE